MDESAETKKLIMDNYKYLEEKNIEKLSDIQRRMASIKDRGKYKIELLILYRRNKEIIDAYKHNSKNNDKFPNIEVIEMECKELLKEKKYEEGLQLLNKYMALGVKHSLIVFYNAIFYYKTKKYKKANQYFTKYSENGYSHILECLEYLITISNYKKHYEMVNNYTKKYKEYYEILKKDKNNKEIMKLSINKINKLLKENKVSEAFSIINGLRLSEVKLLKLKLKIIKYLYIHNQESIANNYYKQVISTIKSNETMKKEIDNFENEIKLLKYKK